MTDDEQPRRRSPLSRPAVLSEAVALADREGIEQVSMRNLAARLGVVPMALYKHVANKEELLDGMVDAVVAEFDPPDDDPDWRSGVRRRILSARTTMLRHPWASEVIASRTQQSAVTLAYVDSLAGMLLAGGLSPELTHLALHTMGSRMWGFNVEVFPSSPPPDDPAVRGAMMAQLVAVFPNVAVIAGAATHSPDTIVGSGCDDQLEFEFGLDLLLDGLERRRA